jgi:NADH-quinone oxidoreductase subunit M
MVGDLSGIADRMPVTGAVFTAAAFGYMGLPFMAGFAGELYIFLGGMQSTFLPNAQLLTAVSMFGIVLVAGYLLFAIQRVLFGPFRANTEFEILPAKPHDQLSIVIVILLIVLLGVMPDLIFTMIQDAVRPILFGGGL